MTSHAFAAEEPDQNLILYGVMLSDQAVEGQFRKINIRIEAGLVENVTEDEIPVKEGASVYDAKSGYVVGHLSLGQPATFLIMNGDPRNIPSRIPADLGNSTGSVGQVSCPFALGC